MMTAPIPPTDGPVVAAPAPAINIANQDPGVPMEILADHPDLSAMNDEAMSAGERWQESIRPLMDSPAGYGADGFQISGDHPAGADGNWVTDMAFGHQGPGVGGQGISAGGDGTPG